MGSLLDSSLALIKRKLVPLATGVLLCVGSLALFSSKHGAGHNRRRLDGTDERLQQLEKALQGLSSFTFKSKEFREIYNAQIDSLKFKNEILGDKPRLYKDLIPIFEKEREMFQFWLSTMEHAAH